MAVPRLLIDDIVVDESGLWAQFVFQLSAPSQSPIPVSYSTSSGSASTFDYESTSGSVTFAPGETNKVVRIAIRNDTSVESNEAFLLNVSVSPSLASLTKSQVTAVIVDDDAPAGTPALRVNTAPVFDERDGWAYFHLMLDRPSTAPVSVTVQTADVTARAGVNYEALGPLTLTFQPGQTARTVAVPLIDNAIAEPTRSFDLRLSAPTGLTLIDSTVRASIGPSDAPVQAIPSLRIDDTVVDESGLWAQFVFQLSAPSQSPIPVSYSTSSGSASTFDYESTSGSVTFAPGETNKVVRIAIRNDTSVESNEVFLLNVSVSPSLASLTKSQVTAVIVDDDAPAGTPALRVNTAPVFDERDGWAYFHLMLDRPSTAPVSVTVQTADVTARAGVNYEALGPLTLTFQPGQTARTVAVPLIDNAIAEPTRSFDLRLSAPTGLTLIDSTVRASIGPSDAPVQAIPSLRIDDTVVDESGLWAQFVFQLSAPSQSPIPVSYSTSSGSASTFDYESTSGSVTFAPGETNKVVRIAIRNDTSVESNEAFLLNVSVSPSLASLTKSQVTAVIVDDDAPAGTPALRVNTAPVFDERDGWAYFHLMLDRPSTAPVSVTVQTADVTARAGVNYEALGPLTLTFQPGQTARTVAVPLIDNAIAEPTRSFDLRLSAPTGLTLIDSTVRASIGPSDAPVQAIPSLRIDDTVVDESGLWAQFVFQLSAPSQSPIPVSYSTSSGSASTFDYESTSGSVTFAPGETNKVVRIAIRNDTSVESNEAFLLNVSVSPSLASLTKSQVTAVIVDDDAPAGTPALRVNTAPVFDERDGWAYFHLMLDRPSTAPVSVTVQTADVTARAGVNYEALGPLTLTFQPGQTARTVAVPLIDNAIAEPTRSFDLRLSAPTGLTLIDSTVRASIGPSDAPVQAIPSLRIDDTVVDESGLWAQFVFQLSAPSQSPIPVSYSTSSGSASTFDYESTSGSVTFAPGETNKVVRIAIRNDTSVESNEVFLLNVSVSPSLASLTKSQVTAVIVDDDAPAGTPALRVNTAPVFDERDGWAYFHLMLDRPSTAPVSVTVQTADVTARAGVNYEALGPLTLTFQPGQTARTVAVPLIDNAIAEPTRSFDLRLSAPTGLTLIDSTVRASIGPSDAPVQAIPSLRIDDTVVDESGLWAQFVFQLSAPSQSPIPVSYSTSSGSASTFDYESTSGSVTFAPGETNKVVRIAIRNDTSVESNEAFLLNVSVSPSLASLTKSQVTAVIVDDDGLPILTITNAWVDESSGNADFVVALSKPSATPVMVTVQTVDGSAKAGQDYQALAPTQVTFAANETVKIVRIPLVVDATPEPNEDFYLEFVSQPANAMLGNQRGMMTIQDRPAVPSTEKHPALNKAAKDILNGDYWSTMASFAEAAYATRSPSDPDATRELELLTKADWMPLTAKHLRDAGIDVDAALAKGQFTRDGVYQAGNSSLLVARCKDALVISFTGTNEFFADMYDNIFGMVGHYRKLDPLLACVDAYASAEKIQNIYVTGHSLGGALAQIYMVTHQPHARPEVEYRAITFAAPGINPLNVDISVLVAVTGLFGVKGLLAALAFELGVLLGDQALRALETKDLRIKHFEIDADLTPDLLIKSGQTVHLHGHGLPLNPQLSDNHSMLGLYLPAVKLLDESLRSSVAPEIAFPEGTVVFGAEKRGATYYVADESDHLDDFGLHVSLIPPVVSLGRYDIVLGGAGDDTISASTASDLYGGPGNDTYIIKNSRPRIVEFAGKDGGDNDTVKADVDGYTLPANVETLYLAPDTGFLFFDKPLSGNGNELNNKIFGNNAANLLNGGAGDDELHGGGGDDRLIGGPGNDLLYGDGGIDWAVFATKRAHFKISTSGTSITVADTVGEEGVDILVNIERVQFSDVSISFDEGGLAIAKLIGAIFGKQHLVPEMVGIGIRYFDASWPILQLAQLAVDTGLFAELAGSRSSADFVRLVYKNVVGVEPGAAEQSHFQGILDRGEMTMAQMAVMAAETAENAAKIDLVGLISNGIEFFSFGG